jgi:DNA-directed RNA polymerase beta' subunit
MEIPHKEIDSIIFGIYSEDEIIKNSVCRITSHKISGDESVYDKRMGSMENEKNCVTCNQCCKDCPGHFGHIEFNTPIIHPLYYRQVISFMKCFCLKCNSFVIDEDHLKLDGILKYKREVRFFKILEKIEKIDTCYKCESQRPKITLSIADNVIEISYDKKVKVSMSDEEIKKVFDNIKDSDVELLGFDPTLIHPKNLILSALPVLPPISRPYIISDGIMCDDDLTVQYLEIIKANNHLLDKDMNEAKKIKYIQTLKFRVKTLMNNSQGKARHTNGRALKAIKERLTGKEGLIRNNLMGKRTNQSGRTVIGPDPTVRTDEMVIPEKIAQTLTVPERVFKHNIFKLQELVNKGKANYVLKNNEKVRINLKYATITRATEVKEGDIIIRGDERIDIDKTPTNIREGDKILRDSTIIPVVMPTKRSFKIEEGDVVERHLQNGDIVLLNRQPTLHKGSMLAKRIVIRPHKTFRFSLASTKVFNADFDGDYKN